MDATFWMVVGLFSVIMWSSWTVGANRHLKRLERRVDLILNHLGLNPNQDVNPQIVELLKAGQKIGAIKLYREQTGCGLKEAKDYVESL